MTSACTEPEVRRAGRQDNDAILEFMRQQSMQAGLSVRFERSPDYFALLEAHSPDHLTWLAFDRGEIVAIASVVVREAYIDRSVRKVAYLADLRQLPRRGIAGLWRRFALLVLAEVRRQYGAEFAFFSILRDNKLARASILDSKIGSELGVRHLRAYSTVSIVGRLPWGGSRRRNLTVSRAQVADSEALRSFIDDSCRQLQFAPVFDDGTWRRRTEGWPDFGIGDFLIARDAGGEISGCLAPWDASRINRIVIDTLPARAELLRRAANAMTLVTRRPRIGTGPDSQLPDLQLTHLHVKQRDPDVLAALLAVAHREAMRTRRYATLSFCIYDDDPLWRALTNTINNSVPMDLYWMPLASEVVPLANDDLWPGFESCLV